MRGTRPLLILALAVLTVAGVLTAPASAVTAKKGVSANNHPGVSAALADVRAGWYYTWASDTLEHLGHPHAALGQVDDARAAWRE
ncbi:hypothetical protein K7G98_06615, partial [Saccharothrix sp. MB29]|nr:hypothetical protein [Saccharothrix sp. MB29]